MRPLSPACGTVLKAQLLTLPATISTSAPGVVTTQLSFLPPASSSATEVFGSSESRPATAQPPEPPPTTTKSKVSVTPVPPGFCCAERPLFRARWQDRFLRGGFAMFLASQKPQKPRHGPFQSRLALIHTARTHGPCPGCLLRKPLDGTDRRRKRWPLSLPARFLTRQSNGLTRGGAAR